MRIRTNYSPSLVTNSLKTRFRPWLPTLKSTEALLKLLLNTPREKRQQIRYLHRFRPERILKNSIASLTILASSIPKKSNQLAGR